MELSRCLCKRTNFYTLAIPSRQQIQVKNTVSQYNIGRIVTSVSELQSSHWRYVLTETIRGTQGRNTNWLNSSVHCEERTEGSWKLQNINCLCGRAEDFRVKEPRVSYVISHLFIKLLSALYLFSFIFPPPEKISSFFLFSFFSNFYLHPIKFLYLGGTSDIFPQKSK